METCSPHVRYLGRSDYVATWQKMKVFTQQRDAQTIDQLWITEHEAVFTQGLNGKPEHLLDTGDIPVIQIDRGGQVTYHGPGQLVVYLLIDVRRRKMGVRGLVDLIEQEIITTLASYNIEAKTRP